MKQKCIEAVSQAIGRQITQQEANGIESKLIKAMRFLASRDQAGFASMSADQRLKEAAKLAAEEVVKEADRKYRVIQLAIEKADARDNDVDEMLTKGIEHLDAVKRTLVNNSDNKSEVQSAESLADAIKVNAQRQLLDTIMAVEPKFFGLFENKQGIIMLTRAIFGEETGNAKIDKGAKAWKEVTTQLREHFNNAGGKIRELSNWALPQHHSQWKVANAGGSNDNHLINQKTWVDFVKPLIDRNKYRNDAGMVMSDTELTEALNSAWVSIASGGVLDTEPGSKGGGMLANRHSQSREIHFKNADAYLAYQERFGEKDLWSVMMGHVEQLSKEIAALETYGPNADHAFKAFLDRNLQKAVKLNPTRAIELEAQAIKIMDLYNSVSGNTHPVVNHAISHGFDTVRNLLSMRLASAFVTSLFTDPATIHLTAMVNNLSPMQLFRNHIRQLNPFSKEDRNLAYRAGLGLDTMIGELNRWGAANLGGNTSTKLVKYSGKLANSVMKLSFMGALDSGRRRMWGSTQMSVLGEMVGKYDSLADLDEWDHRVLLHKGLTEENWQVWKQAKLENWGAGKTWWSAGNGVLTPESINRIDNAAIDHLAEDRRTSLEADRQEKIDNIEQMDAMTHEQKDEAIRKANVYFDSRTGDLHNEIRREALLKLLGLVLTETDMAIIRPGEEIQHMTNTGLTRGTIKGELGRSFFQFKKFPIAMISQHWKRGISEGDMSTAKYLAMLVVGTTILGAAAQTANDLLNGKNPRNYDLTNLKETWKNWVAAFLKGGSAGLYGDFLFSGATQHSQTGPIAAMLGPTAGLFEESFNLTQGNLLQLAKGEDTDFGAESVRMVKGLTPGSSLWYAKAALDHIIFQDLQEYLSPGYLSRMQTRARKEFGQTYYWKPGSGLEGMKSPDIGKAVGQ